MKESSQRRHCVIAGYIQRRGEEDPKSVFVALTLPLEKDWRV